MSNKQNGIPSDGMGRTFNVGYENYVTASRVVAILDSRSLPMKRLREQALEDNLLMDATAGRKTRSMVVLDSGQIVLSAIVPGTLQERLAGDIPLMSRAQLEWKEGELVS